MSKRDGIAVLVSCFVVAAERGASAQVAGTTLHGEDGALFGNRLATVGDVDGDGIDDLLVSENGFTSGSITAAGRVSLFSGATMAWIRDHDGSTAFANFGTAISGAGDLDGDGVPDYLVGAPGEDSNGLKNNGLVVAFSGATGARLWSVAGTAADELVGGAVCGVDDLDGNGRPDVLASEVSNSLVWVIDGGGAVQYSISGANDLFGASLARADDLDGDGVGDWYAGAPGEDTVVFGQTLTDTGAVYAMSGATGTLIFRTSGVNAYDVFGETLATVGDLDGDGVHDVLGGAPDSFAPPRGLAYVVSGQTGALLLSLVGAADGQRFGTAVTGVPDMNHDGVDDFAIGSPNALNGSIIRGEVQLFSGKDGGLLYTWLGGGTISSGNHALGSAVAGGDWNGDGIGDLVLGDPYDVVQHSDRTTHQAGEAAESFGCPAWSENFGSGWPGQNGVPSLTAREDPVPGQLLDVDVGNSLGAATLGLVFVGFTPASVPTGKGGTLLVIPSFSILSAFPAAGLHLSATLPNDPALDFLDVYLQTIELDAFASKGMSFTAGLRLRCGIDLP